MSRTPPAPHHNLGALLHQLVEELAERVVEKLAARAEGEAPTRWASAKDNPLGSARAFLDAGRRGAFPTRKRGREVVAKWADVDAYIEGRPCTREPRPDATPPAPANANAAPAAPLDADARRREQLRAARYSLPIDAAESGAPRRAGRGRA